MSRKCASTRLISAPIAAVLLALTALILWPQSNATQAQPANIRKIDPALRRDMAADPTRFLPVIVEMNHATAPFPPRPNEVLARRALHLLQLFGQPVGALALIDAAAGFATAPGIVAISLDPRVAFIHRDAVIRPTRAPFIQGPILQPRQMSAPYPLVVRADEVWLQGTSGRGVTVAVLDSGIARDDDLVQPTNRLLAAVTFAGERGPLADAGGHGTHVAGIIAGNGTRSAGEYVGVAPRANLVDVRVLDRNGNGRVSSVVRGIEWVLAHQAQYNIRIINLALGAPARTTYRLDPLTAAVEIAWKRGLVVVAAAGNGGPQSGTVETPGIDPYAITAGATDDHRTRPVTDDELAWFSSWGTPPGSTPKPDLVAPGRRLVSLRVPGSFLDRLFPDRVVVARSGATYFRLTGTSMSTAVVAGVAALVLERQPRLNPDQVKALLTGTTQPYGQSSGATLPDPSADGSGLVDAYAAANGSPDAAANQDLRPADGLARTLYPILYGGPLVWQDPLYLGINWAALTWETLTWNNLAWDNLAWDSVAWGNLAWDNLAWDNLAWDNLAWDRAGWDKFAWDTMTLD